MLNKFLQILTLILLFSGELCAQYFNKVDDWKKRRYEYSIGGGVSNYMGELGGLDRKGTYYFLFDLEFSQFKRAFNAAQRYNISYNHATKIHVAYDLISGDDKLTASPGRSYRNLHFKSTVIEVSMFYEYHFLRPKPGHIYNIPGAQGLKAMRWGIYTFVGFGGFYFNPKAQYNGAWVALQPLGTEGQGLPGEKGKYKRVNVCFPTGFGVDYLIHKRFKLGLEFGYRFTLTDYLDDASTDYYDNDQLRAARGDVAADLADPSDGSWASLTQPGEIRGNPRNMDHYMTLTLNLTYMHKKRVKKRKKTKHPFIKKSKTIF